MKEITVFSYGDSRSLATWSNVPYFLTESLKSKGIKINRVDVMPHFLLTKIWNSFFLRIIKLFLPKTTYTFDRTPMFRLLTERKMKRAVYNYPSTDIFISVSFSFHPKKFTTKPVLMFCRAF